MRERGWQLGQNHSTLLCRLMQVETDTTVRQYHISSRLTVQYSIVFSTSKECSALLGSCSRVGCEVVVHLDSLTSTEKRHSVYAMHHPDMQHLMLKRAPKLRPSGLPHPSSSRVQSTSPRSLFRVRNARIVAVHLTPASSTWISHS